MDGGKIDYIQLRASVPPAVGGLVGEIYPTETGLGETSRFTCFVKPTIPRRGQGIRRHRDFHPFRSGIGGLAAH